jgi:calcineurin-like phosphoesterase family protein
MNEKIISNWNERIQHTDTVYHLGDFCFGDPKKYYQRLKGHILFIPGSHDKNLNSSRVDILPSLYVLNLKEHEITLCHYAMRSWSKSHYGTYHLFGHHHGRLEPYGLSFDVGVDTNNFYPYSLDEVAQKMKTLKPIVDYRK